MNENNDEKSVINNGMVNNETVKNLAGNLLKNEKSLGSILQLATTLLKNDSLLNSITEQAVANQSSKNPVSKDAEKQENTVLSVAQNQENFTKDILLEIASISQKLDNIANDVSDFKKELQDIKWKLSKKSKK